MLRRFTLDYYDEQLEKCGHLTPFEKRGYHEAAIKLLEYGRSMRTEVYTHLKWGCYVNACRGKIYLTRKYGPIRQMNAWLHELGHMSVNPTDRHDRYLYELLCSHACRTTADRLIILDREFDAWSSARTLIRELSLCIREKDFTRQEAQCLMSYVRWAHDGGKRIVTRRGW